MTNKLMRITVVTALLLLCPTFVYSQTSDYPNLNIGVGVTASLIDFDYIDESDTIVNTQEFEGKFYPHGVLSLDITEYLGIAFTGITWMNTTNLGDFPRKGVDSEVNLKLAMVGFSTNFTWRYGDNKVPYLQFSYFGGEFQDELNKAFFGGNSIDLELLEEQTGNKFEFSKTDIRVEGGGVQWRPWKYLVFTGGQYQTNRIPIEGFLNDQGDTSDLRIVYKLIGLSLVLVF